MASYQTPSGQVVLLDDDDLARVPGSISIGSHGYAQFWEPELKRMLLLHRWILGLVAKTGYRFIGDHIDRNPMDCRKVNLRIVTPTESNLNRETPDRDLPRGIYQRPSGRYVAKLKLGRKQTTYGTFDTIEEAVAALP